MIINEQPHVIERPQQGNISIDKPLVTQVIRPPDKIALEPETAQTPKPTEKEITATIARKPAADPRTPQKEIQIPSATQPAKPNIPMRPRRTTKPPIWMQDYVSKDK